MKITMEKKIIKDISKRAICINCFPKNLFILFNRLKKPFFFLIYIKIGKKYLKDKVFENFDH